MAATAALTAVVKRSRMRVAARPAVGTSEWTEWLQQSSGAEDGRTALGRAIAAGLVRVRPWPGDPARVQVVLEQEA